MATYSFVKSEPRTTALPEPPPPSTTPTSTTRLCDGNLASQSCSADWRWALSLFSFSASSMNLPPSKMVSPPMLHTQPSARCAFPVAPSTWPTLPTKRPTLGSLPATAHLKSGPFTMARPRCRASASSSAPVTETRMTCCVPSPLRTSCAARSLVSSWSPAANAASSQGSRLLESNTVVSLVDSSPSTEMALKLPLTASRSIFCMASRPPSSLASVIR
mmetsp:Transcript_40050/g.87459  ORF Transcript_40050/g.87459 Transcript_40050/m.87459 type:complete len:218 (+) Transcript_40050:125-778(+)